MCESALKTIQYKGSIIIIVSFFFCESFGVREGNLWKFLCRNYLSVEYKIHWPKKKVLCCAELVSCVQLSAVPGTVARQAPLSTEFSRQEYWNGLPFSIPGDLPDPGIKPTFSFISCIGRRILHHWHQLGSPIKRYWVGQKLHSGFSLTSYRKTQTFWPAQHAFHSWSVTSGTWW